MAADGALFYRPTAGAGAGARAAGGPGGRRHRGRGRVHRRLPAAWLDKKPPGEALAGGCRLAAHALASSARAPFCERSSTLPGGALLADGRVAVVTAGSSGIGAGMAAALARAGARVVLVARIRSGWRSRRRVARCGAEAAWVSADLAERAGWRGPLPRRPGRSARRTSWSMRGDQPAAPLGSLTVEDWDATMAVNLTAPFLLGSGFGPDMADRGWGRIINVTSQQAARAFGNSGGYGASKGGLAALTGPSPRLGPFGVCCTRYARGSLPTRLNAHVAATRSGPRRWRRGR